MIGFTRQERLVVSVLALIIFIGSMIHYVLKEYPQLNDIVNLIDGDELYSKVDLNTASYDELLALPFIGPYTAQQIIDYRKAKGSFTSVDQLKQVRGVKEKNYEKFVRFITIRVN